MKWEFRIMKRRFLDVRRYFCGRDEQLDAEELSVVIPTMNKLPISCDDQSPAELAFLADSQPQSRDILFTDA